VGASNKSTIPIIITMQVKPISLKYQTMPLILRILEFKNVISNRKKYFYNYIKKALCNSAKRYKAKSF